MILRSSGSIFVKGTYRVPLRSIVLISLFSGEISIFIYFAGQVGLGVGSWPSNRATEGSNPKGTRLYFVILLKNVEKKSLISTDITV